MTVSRGRDRGRGPAARAEEARLVVEPSGALLDRGAAGSARGEAGLDGARRARSSRSSSGGNVDPDRYVAYLESPIPPEG